MEATIAGTGAVTADLSNTVVFQATISGVGTVTADFVRQVSLEVATAGLGVLAADVTVTGGGALVELEVLISGVGTVTPDKLDVTRSLATVIAGVGTVAPDLTVTGVAVGGVFVTNNPMMIFVLTKRLGRGNPLLSRPPRDVD